MLFNSFTYPAFLFLTTVLYWRVPMRLRLHFLIGAGFVFYIATSFWMFAVIAGLSIFTWFAGRFLLRYPRSGDAAVPFFVAVIVLTLVFFKYLGLLLRTVSEVGGMGLSIPHIVMPLGISFFTFEFIHYLTDIHRKKIGPHGFLEFASFAFFFPTLVSGPIKRFQPFLASVASRTFESGMLWTGVLLLVAGYMQKYMLADPLIPFTATLAHPQLLPTTVSALGGLVLYSFRIYFDFAGLSNIAIGSAMLLGIVVPKNFDRPYLRPNIQQFWRYWHMSLSSWVRDYIYITLGGNRRGTIMTVVNLLLAMIIVGLWHGAGWNFAAWGLYHGLGLAGHRLWAHYRPGIAFFESFVWRIVATILTFLFVTAGWAFFVTTSLTDSLLLLSKAFPL